MPVKLLLAKYKTSITGASKMEDGNVPLKLLLAKLVKFNWLKFAKTSGMVPFRKLLLTSKSTKMIQTWNYVVSIDMRGETGDN